MQDWEDWGTAESRAVDMLIETYADFFCKNHGMEYKEAVKFVYEIVMSVMDYISGKPTGGERVGAVSGKETYSAAISLPEHLNLRFLFREVRFGWTLNYEEKKTILEWFKLIPW